MELKDVLNLPLSELEHSGVKGMKWGRTKSAAASYMKKANAHEAKSQARKAEAKVASKAKYEAEKADWARGKAKVKAHIDKNKLKDANRLEKRAATKKDFKEKVTNTVEKVGSAYLAEQQAKKAASKAKYEAEKADWARGTAKVKGAVADHKISVANKKVTKAKKVIDKYKGMATK